MKKMKMKLQTEGILIKTTGKGKQASVTNEKRTTMSYAFRFFFYLFLTLFSFPTFFLFTVSVILKYACVGYSMQEDCDIYIITLPKKLFQKQSHYIFDRLQSMAR